MSLMQVIKSIGGKKNFGVEFQPAPNPSSCIARVLLSENNSVQGFVNAVEGSTKTVVTVEREFFDIEPIFPISNEGLGIIISGEQGSGKSTMGALFVMQYEKMYPTNRTFLISQKQKSIDKNLSQIEDLIQLKDEDIIKFKLDNYRNTLFLIDDSDFGDNVKYVMKLLNLVSTVGREYNISWIFITHYNSRLNQTKAYTEYKVYITYQDNLNNNRMLMVHMGLNRKAIDKLVEMNSSFYMFNKMYNVLLTDKYIYKFSSLKSNDKLALPVERKK